MKMVEMGGGTWQGLRSMARVSFLFLAAAVFVSAKPPTLKPAGYSRYTHETKEPDESGYLSDAVNFLWQSHQSGYQHVWPVRKKKKYKDSLSVCLLQFNILFCFTFGWKEISGLVLLLVQEMKFGWEIVLGTMVGVCGAAFGSVGGVGGGGIFVPMLSIIIGFDPKSSTAISKCMVFGAAGSTVYYNLRQRHPTLDLPIIDYDLALLFQPMLMLGISIGVVFNVVFADWMITVLLIILFITTSSTAFLRGVNTWKKETISKMEAAKGLESNGSEEVAYEPLPSAPSTATQTGNSNGDREISIIENVYWKKLGLLVFVWIAFLVLQIAKKNTTNCSIAYWTLNLLQVPVAVGVTLYEAIGLYQGRKVITSKGDVNTNWKVHQLILYSASGVLAGIVGGLLGLGGGFIMGPLFLELGIPPQVSSATSTFAMMFSSSMSVVEYYLLKRFPVPYALYFVAVATVAAFVGQHLVGRLIRVLGRASLIIFILAFTIFVSAISLGGIGISNMIGKIHRHEYMGFENLCKYDA